MYFAIYPKIYNNNNNKSVYYDFFFFKDCASHLIYSNKTKCYSVLLKFFSPVPGALSLSLVLIQDFPSLRFPKGLPLLSLFLWTFFTMAEDVINSLENMKLTSKQEEVIALPDEGRKEEIESYALSLIGKFLTCKLFSKKAAQDTLRRAWGMDKGMHIVEEGSNLFQFKFKTELELERVFKGGPWTFDNQVLLLRKW